MYIYIYIYTYNIFTINTEEGALHEPISWLNAVRGESRSI